MGSRRSWSWVHRLSASPEGFPAALLSEAFQRFLWEELSSAGLDRLEAVGPSGPDAVIELVAIRRDDAESAIAFPTLGQIRWLEIRGMGLPSPQLVDAWTVPLAAALERLGEPLWSWPWSGIVGPELGRLAIVVRLVEGGRIGPLRLEPQSDHVIEHRPSETPGNSPGAMTTWAWWPIVVRGTGTGRIWDEAATFATIQLHRLVALLSLAWDAPWTMRASPIPDDVGDVRVPTGELFRPEWIGEEASERTPLERQGVWIEPWMDHAWDRLDEAALGQSLAIFYEGRTLFWTHPSLAMVSFVASIEAIGGRSGLDRCATCGLIIRSTERFREALRRVIPDDDAARLARLVYQRRSRTVHDGVLHGAENEFGHFLRGRPWTNPGFDGIMTLFELARVSRLVLLDALTSVGAEGRRPEP